MTSRLVAEHITKGFGDKTIIDKVSIRADRGELVSLLGVSGAGKTTLFNCISGIYDPDDGQVLLDGEDITGETGRISYMLQKDLLLPHKKVVDNVALPLILRGTSKEEARAKAMSHFGEFGLEGTEEMWPSQLSGGMRQRAALLRTYMFSDKVALLDEPFSALDTITRSRMHRWYLDVMEEIKLTTLFITHDIDEAIMLSDRIYILAGRPGRIAGELTIERPRTERGDFELTEEFLDYKRKITDLLDR